MKSRLIPHPILFSAHPVLYVCAKNIDFAPRVGAIAILLGAFCAVAALLARGLTRLLKDERKAAIVASAFVVMFFSYGHFRNLLGDPLDGVRLLSVGIGYKKVLAAAWALAWLGLAAWLRRASPASIGLVTRALNAAAASLAALGVAMTVSASVSGPTGSRRASAAAAQARTASVERLPDIYYIILDDYARDDVLREVYGFDNAPFLDWLQAKGFYVARDSRANYVQTMLSLASSLNSEYLDPARLASDASGHSGWRVALNAGTARFLALDWNAPRRPLVHMIQFSEAVRTLRRHGYRFVTVTSGYDGVELPNADVVIRGDTLSDFEESLLATTPIADLTRAGDPFDVLRTRILYALDHFADPVNGNAPNFVFVHILSPHPPFFFHRDGSLVEPMRAFVSRSDVSGLQPEERGIAARAYTEQLAFVNSRITCGIDAILARARTPPLIVLQSDHGSDILMDWPHPTAAALSERSAILNAFYVPRDIRRDLYAAITPVNTFRVLFRHYFPGDYVNLPDRTYFSTYERPYDLTPVPQP